LAAVVGRGPEALNQRDGAAVALVGAQACLLQQVAAENALHDLQHWRDQFGLCGQQQAQGDRKQQHPAKPMSILM
jgi:hypothetical protein